MRKNITAVITAFVEGRAKGGETCSTDGHTIFSYAMPIACRTADERLWVVRKSDSPSRTTTSQISAVRYYLRYANVTEVDADAMRRACDERPPVMAPMRGIASAGPTGGPGAGPVR